MENEILIGGVEKREIIVVTYDPSWPHKFRYHAQVIADALGETALSIEHVGSTSVPDLAAKPIVDMIIVVPDASDEDSYLYALVKSGYVLRVREPDWHQHRMFRTPELDVHIHVFPRTVLKPNGNLPSGIGYGQTTVIACGTRP